MTLMIEIEDDRNEQKDFLYSQIEKWLLLKYWILPKQSTVNTIFIRISMAFFWLQKNKQS